jgi:hypothetical protein
MNKDTIIKSLKIEKLSPAMQDETIRRLEEIIQYRVIQKIATLYPEIDMTKDMTDREAEKILREKIPNIKDLARSVAVETISDFKKKTA